MVKINAIYSDDPPHWGKSMNTKKNAGIFHRLTAVLDGPSNATNSRELIFWGSAVSALVIGVLISVTTIVAVQRKNNLEERAKLMRMCREDPRFDIKTCTSLLKPAINRATRHSNQSKNNGGAHGSSGSANDGKTNRLSDLNMGNPINILE